MHQVAAKFCSAERLDGVVLAHALPQTGKLRILQKLVQPFIAHHHNARAFGIACVSGGQSLEFTE